MFIVCFITAFSCHSESKALRALLSISKHVRLQVYKCLQIYMSTYVCIVLEKLFVLKGGKKLYKFGRVNLVLNNSFYYIAFLHLGSLPLPCRLLFARIIDCPPRATLIILTKCNLLQ